MTDRWRQASAWVLNVDKGAGRLEKRFLINIIIFSFIIPHATLTRRKGSSEFVLHLCIAFINPILSITP